jgi:hypothetical protein
VELRKQRKCNRREKFSLTIPKISLAAPQKHEYQNLIERKIEAMVPVFCLVSEERHLIQAALISGATCRRSAF